MKNYIKFLALSLVVAGLSSCAAGVQDLAPEHPTVKESYKAAMNSQTDYVVHNGGENMYEATGADGKKYKKPEKVELPSMGGALQNPDLMQRQADINEDFPMLPNPQVMLYLYPHFQNGLPIHGNWTTFTMYETNHYALPSEVATGNNLRTYK